MLSDLVLAAGKNQCGLAWGKDAMGHLNDGNTRGGPYVSVQTWPNVPREICGSILAAAIRSLDCNPKTLKFEKILSTDSVTLFSIENIECDLLVLIVNTLIGKDFAVFNGVRLINDVSGAARDPDAEPSAARWVIGTRLRHKGNLPDTWHATVIRSDVFKHIELGDELDGEGPTDGRKVYSLSQLVVEHNTESTGFANASPTSWKECEVLVAPAGPDRWVGVATEEANLQRYPLP